MIRGSACRNKHERVENINTVEKAILIGLDNGEGAVINGRGEAERSLDELAELSLTAGLTVVGKVLQKREVRDAATYIGSGKLEEAALMIKELEADTLVFDDELSGAQIRNIEKRTDVKVIDRTTLILDIFAQRARSSEGKLQVELAQLRYRLPRLTGLGGQLSRLGGGIGTRGPGEKKLETDRRHIRRRVSRLEAELDAVALRRDLMRGRRRQSPGGRGGRRAEPTVTGGGRAGMPVIALAGYTNSGKSTLLNRLCRADVLAEDKLFATLDPTMRRLELPGGRAAIMADTVGFIRKLPHELVEAFKSTLEEVIYADVLLHIVDASDEEAEEHIAVAEKILESLGAASKPTILVLNKIDLIRGNAPTTSSDGFIPPATDDGPTRPVPNDRLRILNKGRYCGIVELSALTGQGVEDLLRRIEEILPADQVEACILAPYSEGWIASYLRGHGTVLSEEYTEAGVRFKARVDKTGIEKIREYIE